MIESDAFNASFPVFWHGGDYNPDQWLDQPKVIDEDFRLFPLAGVNVVSIGIFAWTRLEPAEGKYDFTWLDKLMDRLHFQGMKAVLATPSGARPAWMSQKYPEVLRVDANRVRILHGARHNHCYTSPVYRKKTAKLNEMLAKRYADHPALSMWHVSNEYGGDCHCPLCQKAFREWLKKRYGTLDALNRAYWTDFWSHRYTDWEQLESPAPHGEMSVHALILDWRRFVTHQSLDFFLNEAAPLRKITPQVPVTINMMETYGGLDYWKFAPHVDAISWDSYPYWHNGFSEPWETAATAAFNHDLFRSLKQGKPFMLMESTPSQVNWHPVNRLKKPGVHILSSLQAVAHGSDTVMYFQWRKGRGAAEKFHGAVVSHEGHEHTRVFQEVAELGKILQKLTPVLGTRIPAQAAVIFDWENRWAIDEFQGAVAPARRNYQKTCEQFYRPFWARGLGADVIDMDQDFSSYKILCAPMLYMVKPGVAERLKSFVENGGTLVTTYLSGMVNESDLCFLGGFPGPLRPLTGVWAEELDVLYENQTNAAVAQEGNSLGLSGSYKVEAICELVHPEGAQVQAVYASDFYQGRPVVTLRSQGKGKVVHIAARTEQKLVDDVLKSLIAGAGLKQSFDADWEPGVSVSVRSSGTQDFIFVMNFTDKETPVKVHEKGLKNALDGSPVGPSLVLAPWAVKVLQRD